MRLKLPLATGLKTGGAPWPHFPFCGPWAVDDGEGCTCGRCSTESERVCPRPNHTIRCVTMTMTVAVTMARTMTVTVTVTVTVRRRWGIRSTTCSWKSHTSTCSPYVSLPDCRECANTRTHTHTHTHTHTNIHTQRCLSERGKCVRGSTDQCWLGPSGLSPLWMWREQRRRQPPTVQNQNPRGAAPAPGPGLAIGDGRTTLQIRAASPGLLVGPGQPTRNPSPET